MEIEFDLARITEYKNLWTQVDIDPVHHDDFTLLISTYACLQNNPSLRQNQYMFEYFTLIEWAILQRARCNCLNAIPFDTLVLYVRQLSTLPMKMTCHHLSHLHLFTTQENKAPNQQELKSFIDASRQMNTDSQQYCIDHAVDRPLPDVSKLQKKRCTTSGTFCSICQDGIQLDQMMYELPCKHAFHADDSDCLGEGCTIMKWFESHRQCPTCNVEVTL